MSVNRSEQELVRINALEQLRAMGIEPFPAAEFKASHKAEELLEDFKEGKEVVLAGRLMSVRVMGKA